MNISENQIEHFLNRVDKLFPVSLSEKQNLHEYAIKLSRRATVCLKVENEEIVSAVFGYTENVVDNMAYISVVATLPNAQGKNYASTLVGEFIEIAKSKGLNGVHLYTDPSNERAKKLYEKLGFQVLKVEDELRPNDAHLVYYIEQ